MLNEITVKTTLSKYYVIRKQSYYETEEFNDRGFRWSEPVKKTKEVKVQVSEGRYYEIKEDYLGEITIAQYLKKIGPMSCPASIKKALSALEINLRDNNAKLDRIAKDSRYTEQYKAELSKEILEDTQKTNELIVTLNGYMGDKDRKKEVARLNKMIRELKGPLQDYLNNKWKFNETYIKMVEGKVVRENPELVIEFGEEIIKIKTKSELTKQVALKQVKAPM